ncbi:hypothetical protein QL285_025635 [Trifolium repens]|nr:hypothetical protein QL285_025635 [Trifolium repens]
MVSVVVLVAVGHVFRRDLVFVLSPFVLFRVLESENGSESKGERWLADLVFFWLRMGFQVCFMVVLFLGGGGFCFMVVLWLVGLISQILNVAELPSWSGGSCHRGDGKVMWWSRCGEGEEVGKWW